MAERGGADPAKLRDALLGGFAYLTVFRLHGKRMVDGNFAPGGPAKYQIKDTGTALALASSLGLTLPVATEVDRLFRGLVEHGGGDLDAWDVSSPTLKRPLFVESHAVPT